MSEAEILSGKKAAWAMPVAWLRGLLLCLGALCRIAQAEGRTPLRVQDAAVTYYSYQSGPYTAPATWTTDYTGASAISPPPAGGPDGNDRIVILPGRTVTVNVNATSPDSVHIRAGATLALGATTGHSFGRVEGQGLLQLGTGALPTAVYGSLTQPSGGTVEYTAFTGTIDPAQNSYHHLVVSGAGVRTLSAATARSLTLSGSLTLTGGAQLTLGSAAAPIRLSVAGDVAVGPSASLRVAAFNTGHTLAIGGSLVSAGSVRLHNLAGGPTLAHYTSLTTTGYATVEMTGPGSAAISLSGQEASFYFLRVNKSSSADVVTLAPARRAFFTLYGRNNQPDTAIDTDTAPCTKALRPDRGTLVLADSVSLPSLTEGGGMFRIGSRAGLVLQGFARVTATATGPYVSEIAPYGTLRLAGGRLEGGSGMGLRLLSGGQYVQESGTAVLSQISTYRSAGLGAPTAAFTLNGGTLTVDGSGATDPSFARFDLLWATMSATVSGGTVNIYRPVGTSASVMKNGGLRIGAGTTAYTGGTWNLYLPPMPDLDQGFGLSVSGRLWAANLFNQGAYTSSRFVLGAMPYADNGFTGTSAARALTVSTSLVQGPYAALDANSQTLTIGDSWQVAATAGFAPGASPTQLTRFGQGIAGQGTACTVSLLYPNPTFAVLEFDNSATGAGYTFSGNDVTCTGELRFYDGAINHNGVRFYAQGGVDFRTTMNGPGRVILQGPAGADIAATSSGRPWELEIDKTPTGGVYPVCTLQGPLSIRHALILNRGVVDAGGNILTTLAGCHLYNGAGDSTQAAFGPTNLIATNDSGSVQRHFAPAYRSLVWPIGSGVGGSLKYRPVLASVAGASTYGYARFQARDGRHPEIAIPPATANDALSYWWSEFSGGWSGAAGVSVSYVYQPADIPPAADPDGDAAYLLGRYYYSLTDYWITAPYATQAANTLTKTGFANGDYTAGNALAFTNPVEYWSRVSGSWGRASTWRRRQGAAWLDAVYATTAPPDTGVVVIQDNTTVTLNDSVPTLALSRLVFIDDGSLLDLDTTLSRWPHSFGTVKMGAGGGVRIAYGRSGVRRPGGDWAGFFASGANSRVTYRRQGVDFTIPRWAPAYRYLTLLPDGGSITLPDTALAVGKAFAVTPASPGTVYVSSAASADITCSSTTEVGAQASLVFPATVARTWKQNGGDLTLAGRVVTDTAAGQDVYHRLELRTNLLCTGTFDWQPGSTATARGQLYWNGSGNALVSGAAQLFRLANFTLNKSNYRGEVTVTPFYLKGDAGLAAALKPIVLTAGSLRLNTPPATGAWLLNSGSSPAADFKIRTGAALELYQGTALVNATGTNAGLTLEGRLTMQPGTRLRIGSNAATDSYLQLSTSAGTPTLQMAGDSLIVSGQLRTQAAGAARACSLTVSGGTVVIARVNALVPTRPVFEVPPRSYFAQSGGAIVLCRSLGIDSADYRDGSTSGALTGGLFQFGYAATPSGTVFRSAGYRFWDMRLRAAGQSVKPALTFGPAPVDFYGDVRTDPGTALALADSVTYGGDLLLDGSYSHTAPATFDGQGRDQLLTAPLGFEAGPLRYAPSLATSQLTMMAGPSHSTRLAIAQGTLQTGATVLAVAGSAANYGTHASTTGYLSLNGDTAAPTTLTSGPGARYGSLTLNDARGTRLVGSLSLMGDLTLSQGVLEADTLGIALGEGGTIRNGNAVPFSGTKCIRLTGTLADSGIRKAFAAGPFAITFPLAVGGSLPYEYVPAAYAATANTAPGTLRVQAVRRRHPATVDPADKELALYWRVAATGFGALSVSHAYTYAEELQAGRGDEAAYVPARYIDDWHITGGTVDVPARTLRIPAVPYLTGDYTAGEPSEFPFTDASLPVTLTTLTAVPVEPGIRLGWATRSEQNSQGFQVERSADGGRSFTAIGYLPTQAPGGQSASLLSYQWLDKAPVPGLLYYRLRQQDRDGRQTLSPIAQALWVVADGPASLTVSPNPAPPGHLTARYQAQPAPVTWAIVDNLGHVLWQQTATLPTPSGELDLTPAGPLRTGLYTLTLTQAGTQLRTRFAVR